MLLDTHVLLWLLGDDPRLGPRARAQLSRVDSLYVSTASLWELAIKAELGKIEVPDDLPDLVEQAHVTWLAVSPRHAWESRSVTGLAHRDPFDRLLVSQAICESLTLLTVDRALLGADLGPPVTLLDAHD